MLLKFIKLILAWTEPCSFQDSLLDFTSDVEFQPTTYLFWKKSYKPFQVSVALSTRNDQCSPH